MPGAPGWAGVDTGNLLPSLGNAMMSAFGTAASAPRRALWDVGPTLVGRSGQGPQSGTDLLGRLGMNPDAGLTQALGFGAEMAGDPLTMMGAMGMARGRVAGLSSPQPTAPGLGNVAEQMASIPAPTPLNFPRPSGIAPAPLVPYRRVMSRMAPDISPFVGLELPPGVHGPLRPASAIQNVGTPLMTESLFGGSAPRSTNLLERLQRVTPRPPGPAMEY